MKQREAYKLITNEPAKGRLERGECPSCGLPKSKWKRRIDWRCCSTKCTEKWTHEIVTYGWPDLRIKAFKRDKFTCVKCGHKPMEKTYEGKMISDTSKLIGDHIKPIALGGDQWEIDNVQTLCLKCDKIKTKEDAGEIAKERRKEKRISIGQEELL